MAPFFSEGEEKLLLAILQFMGPGDIKIDWDKVAQLCKYKDASIAKTRYAQIRKKKILPAAGEGKGKADDGEPKTEKKKTVKKGQVKDEVDNEE